MDFSPELGFWSPFVFWYCVVNAIASVGFTLVVIIGGFHDLKFLFRALREETVDETDDGRAQPPPTDHTV